MNHVSPGVAGYTPPWIEPPDAMPTGLQLLSTLRGNRLLSIPAAAYEQDMLSGNTALQRVHMLMAPDAVRHVLQDKAELYALGKGQQKLFRAARHSIFGVEGRRWKRHRKPISQHFSFRANTASKPVTLAAIDAMLDRLQQQGPRVDLYAEFRMTMFDIITRSVVGPDASYNKPDLLAAIDCYFTTVCRLSILDYLPTPKWSPQPRYLWIWRQVRFIHQTVQTELDRHRRGIASSEFIERLSESVDPETGERLDDIEIRDNIIASLTAGHDTTTSTISWLVFLLAQSPELQEVARAEVLSVAGGDGENLAAVPGQLPLCRQIIDETERLYPAGPILSRQAVGDDEILGRTIKRGDVIIIPVCAINRHSAHWTEPHRFNPERFATRPDRYTFMPFGGGQRFCPGAALAYQQMELLLSALLIRYRFHATDQIPQPYADLTLKPQGGVHLRLERLNARGSRTQQSSPAATRSDVTAPAQSSGQIR